MNPHFQFPHVIDSTMLADFASCPRRFYYTYIQHFKSKQESIHLRAGAAYAKGLEVARKAFYQDHLDIDTSEALGARALMEVYGDFECPNRCAKTLPRMLGALEFYFANYPLGVDTATPIELPGGKRGVEFSFAEPLDFVHPETGDPLLFSGRADMVVDFAGSRMLLDDKTTSQLGNSWLSQWDLRSQFTGYSWAAKRAQIPVTGTLVRGVSILKTKYETLQALTYRGEWELDRWEEQLYKSLARIMDYWERGDWQFNLNYACNEYGGCQFRHVCKAHPRSEMEILEGEFARRIWDPLTHKELTIEEWEANWQPCKPEPIS